MAVSQRYQPGHPAGQTAVYGIDLSSMLPPGLGVINADAQILTNSVPPQTDPAINVSNPMSRGRRVWATVEGGTQGTDYRISWTITDNQSNIWLITVLLLCAATS